MKRKYSVFLFLLLFQGCAAIYGWKIHAPGILSENYYQAVTPSQKRVALYLPDQTVNFESTNKGGGFADPQTYFIGESFAPMVIEGMQQAFTEFILLETKPTPELMNYYAIPYLVTIRMDQFRNRVTMKGQAVELDTIVEVLDQNLNAVKKFSAKGSSDAQKVFAKKGGPEVNLNAAIENNVSVTTSFLQDFLK